MKIILLSAAFWSSALLLQAQAIIETSISRYSSFIDSSFYIRSAGDMIFCRKWENRGVCTNPKAILILHGIGFYGDPYRKIMNYVKDDRICVYAMDMRGHGLSGKTKGELESNEMVLMDIENVLNVMKSENPFSEIFLAGVSMGGVYALGYALKDTNQTDLAGLILVGIALKLHRSQVLQAGNLKLLYPLIADREKAVIDIDGKRIKKSSDDPKFIEMRRKDTLCIHRVSWKYVGIVREMQRTCRDKSALANVHVPVLILQGGKDRIIDMKGAAYLNRNMKNTEKDIIIYDQSHHSLFWDIDSSRVFTDLLKWVERN